VGVSAFGKTVPPQMLGHSVQIAPQLLELVVTSFS
jgi:hypothetical protein